MNDQKLPNATAVLVLGILSILGSCCYGLPGMIMGIIGIVLSTGDSKKYKANPTLYSNYGNLQTGKVLSIIGLVLGLLFLVFIVVLFSAIGLDALQDEALMKARIEELFGQ